jgi:hypothetical protein
MVIEDCPVHLARQDKMDVWANLDCEGHQDHQVSQAQMVTRVRREYQQAVERWNQVNLGKVAMLDRKAHLDHKEHQVKMDRQAAWDKKDQKELQVQQETQATPVQQVQLVHQVEVARRVCVQHIVPQMVVYSSSTNSQQQSPQ